jgi:endonuclease/exonuclease/phosphatase family metal-dependent hydrolase
MKLMTLNIGHGRAGRATRSFRASRRVRGNLHHVALMLRREAPDVVAFQEMDRSSIWSGNFDHSAFLAELAEYPHLYLGSHFAIGRFVNYGTAIMARHHLLEPETVIFHSALARPRKGFVVSSIHWPDQPDLKIDVVSLHLDFLRAARRREEIERLIQFLTPRKIPRIVMGDFNTGYGNPKLIPFLAERLGLHTWLPREDLVTFPALRRRLDWVLVSDDFRFIDHRIVDDPVSDHHAVLAEIVLNRSNADPPD